MRSNCFAPAGTKAFGGRPLFCQPAGSSSDQQVDFLLLQGLLQSVQPFSSLSMIYSLMGPPSFGRDVAQFALRLECAAETSLFLLLHGRIQINDRPVIAPASRVALKRKSPNIEQAADPPSQEMNHCTLQPIKDVADPFFLSSNKCFIFVKCLLLFVYFSL